MIATRFRTVGWVAGVASAALCFYLVSQSVAAERAGLARIDHRIADTVADIARLQTEIGTRGRMSQLDRWNSEWLALQAPGARQFVASEVQLASFNAPRALPLDPAVASSKGAVVQAAYAGPAPAPAAPPAARPPETAAAPLLHVATYVRPKPDRLGGDSPSAVIKVAFDDMPAAAVDRPVLATAKTAAAPRGAGMPIDLLPTDIDSLATAERKARSRR